MTTHLSWIAWTVIGSAASRLLLVFALWEGMTLLRAGRSNYPNPPRVVVPTFAFVSLVLLLNILDLIGRAITTATPHPLMTGYLLSAGMVMGAISMHVWLQRSWLPQGVRQGIDARTKVFKLATLCGRKRRLAVERREIARAERTSDYYPPQTDSQDVEMLAMLPVLRR